MRVTLRSALLWAYSYVMWKRDSSRQGADGSPDVG